MRKMIICSTVLVFAFSLGIGSAFGLTDIEMLGKELFFDENLSIRLNQSCATCHAPETGFTGPNSDINAGPAIYPGSIHTKAGNRKPPTAAYGGESPILYADDKEDECFFTGGMFWDGRATGKTLGDPLAEQALGPFLNFLEQANPKAMLVCLKVQLSDYADLFEQVWGPGSLDCVKDLDGTYERIGLSIAAYEKSSEVNPFDSQFDYFVAEQGGDVSNFGIEVITLAGMEFRRYVGLPDGFSSDYFTDEEAKGLAIFNADSYTQLELNLPPNQVNGGFCYACHLTENHPGTNAPLFTDFTYDNLGIPKNPQNPFYNAVRKYNPDGEDWVDLGLGGFLATREDYSACKEENYGKHKVPTLRNVDKRPYDDFVKAYGHNGYFKSLEDIVSFYNKRDLLPPQWPEAEVVDNVNKNELGNLGLSPQQEADLVAFMKTLSDGYVPPSP